MVLNTLVRMAATSDPTVTPTATHKASFNEESARGGKILNSATTVNLPTYEVVVLCALCMVCWVGEVEERVQSWRRT